jgi:hypothetical protein
LAEVQSNCPDRCGVPRFFLCTCGLDVTAILPMSE